MIKIKESPLRSLLSKSLRVLTLPIRDLISTELKLVPIEGMETRSLEMVPQNEFELVSGLMSRFRVAKEQQGTVPQPYLPGAYWKELLESEWSRCYEAVARDDVKFMANFLRNFFRNEGLTGFWGAKKMFEVFEQGRDVRRADLMRRQFEAWRAAFPKTDVKELEAPSIGNPWGYIIEGTLIYEPAFEYHYHAHYFSQLLADIPNPVVVEIGGGFGGLAYHLMKRIPGIKYIGFDLPENILIQDYYLSCAFPEQAFTLRPNFDLPYLNLKADLIINIRSLSEMPLETILEYHRQIDSAGRLFFFHENLSGDRADQLYGIVSSQFPQLKNFRQVSSSVSRWPRYQDGPYPCREHLLIHRSRLSVDFADYDEILSEADESLGQGMLQWRVSGAS
jgi:putative sugar O-methyltransferase